MQIITDDEVVARLDPAMLTQALESALVDLAEGRAASTMRVRASADGAMASALAAAWPAGGITGGKLYATRDGVFTFVTVLFDLAGRALALIEGDQLTRLRTAASTALAIRHLLPAPTRTVTVIGTGRQCPGHLDMLARELPDIDELRLVGVVPAELEAAAAHAARLGLPVVTSSDPAEAVTGAGLVLTLTSSRQPLFPASALADQTLICALGSTKADRVELGPDVVGRADRIITDGPDGARVECGDLLAAVAAGTCTWEQVEDLAVALADRVHGRAPRPTGVVLFESQGIALQDVVAGGLVVGA